MQIPSDFLSCSQAAKTLGISAATLRRWATASLLPSVRTPGGHRRFRVADLDRFAQRDQSPGDDTDLYTGDPLAIEAALYQRRVELGSWWSVSETLDPCVLDIFRRCEAGLITTIQRNGTFERLQRALTHFLDRLPCPPNGQSILLAAVPGDRLRYPLVTFAIGAKESGFVPRWAGQATPEEIIQELKREPAAGVIVSASLGADQVSVARYAAHCRTIARAASVPVAATGLWSLEPQGVSRPRGCMGLRAWMEQLRQ